MNEPVQQTRDWSLILAWSIASAILAVGLSLLLGLVGNSLWEACLMTNAVQAEGRLLSVELGSSNTYKRYTNALYQYEFGGVTHQSDRLALFKQTRSFYEPLKADMDHNQPIRVWVDPDDPQHAVLDREFVLWPFAGGLVFSLGWSSMGLYLMKRIWRTTRKDSEVAIIRRSGRKSR